MTVASVHVLRYDAGRSWADLRAARPGTASYWHPGLLAVRDAGGIPVEDEREWSVLAVWPDADTWRRALAEAGPWVGAREAWSCLLAAGETRVNPAAPRWAEGGLSAPFGPPAVEEPTGPVAVVTTVGHSGDHLAPVLRFARDVDAIVETLPEAAGCLGYRLGAAEDFPQSVDAFTFSLWASWADARTWAYRGGVHAHAMRDHMNGEHVLRGSFTTFAVLEVAGAAEVIDDEIVRLLSQPRDRRLRLTSALT